MNFHKSIQVLYKAVFTSPSVCIVMQVGVLGSPLPSIGEKYRDYRICPNRDGSLGAYPS